MRDPERIERILEKLERLWSFNPDMRLGQLMENLAVSYDLNGPKLYHIEDDKMEEQIEAVLWSDWEGARKR